MHSYEAYWIVTARYGCYGRGFNLGSDPDPPILLYLRSRGFSLMADINDHFLDIVILPLSPKVITWIREGFSFPSLLHFRVIDFHKPLWERHLGQHTIIDQGKGTPTSQSYGLASLKCFSCSESDAPYLRACCPETPSQEECVKYPPIYSSPHALVLLGVCIRAPKRHCGASGYS